MDLLDDAALMALLREDAPHGDLTTRALGLEAVPARLVARARTALRVCGTEHAARLFTLAGGCGQVHVASGTDAAADALLFSAEGPAAALHLAWKTAQTLVERLSGIASATAAIVTALRDAGFELPLVTTRKTFPGTRAWCHAAVVAGGGSAHRLGLSETLLVFPEHAALLAPDELVKRLARLRAQNPEKRVVAEARTLAEARWLAASGVDVLQLERFTPEQLGECRAELRRRGLGPLLAPAGGVTVHNAVAFAQAGADLLVSSAPYLASPCDVAIALSAREPEAAPAHEEEP